MDPDSKRRAGRGLRVAVTDRLGRPLHAPGLAAWLCRVAPLSARGAVAVALVTDARIRTLNERFRHVATATDVLSFPSSDSGEARLATSTPGPETRVLGDIVISTDTARRQARDAGHSYAVELKILALHGLLHLLGYDHDARSDRGRMARLERRLRAKGGLRAGLIERARAPKGQREGAQQSEPRDRSEPAPFDAAQGAVSASRTAKRRARARAGESKRRRPSGKR